MTIPINKAIGIQSKLPLQVLDFLQSKDITQEQIAELQETLKNLSIEDIARSRAATQQVLIQTSENPSPVKIHNTQNDKEFLYAINPANGEILEKISCSTPDEVKSKVGFAKEAFPMWSKLPIEARIGYIKNIYQIIVQRKDHIAEIITKNNGKPLAESYLTDIAATLQIMDYFIKNGSKLLSDKSIPLGLLYPTTKSFLSYSDPYGTVAIIQPWNYPFYLPMVAITKGLLTGNTVVFKPSENTPLVGKLIEEILTEAKLPNGVANVVYGDGSIGEVLTSQNIDKVIFTGSVNVGKKIAAKCGEKLIPVGLELGGKDPAIVLRDTNIDYAVKGIWWGALTNSGQACASIERVYVDSSIHDEFVKKLTEATEKLKIGNGFDDDTDMGPVINERQLRIIEDHVNDALSKGAILHTGGQRLSREGLFFAPTVLSNVDHTMKIMIDESFAPVIPVMKFNTIEEAIKLANDTRYGLSASVWTADKKTGKEIARSLSCGTVWINNSLFQQAHPACPWIGYKESGYGGASIYDFVKPKHISIDKGSIPLIRTHNPWWFPYKGKSKTFASLIDVMHGKDLKTRLKAVGSILYSFVKR